MSRNDRHRDDSDDTDTDEIGGTPHRLYATMVNEKGERVPDPTSWRHCECARGTNHT